MSGASRLGVGVIVAGRVGPVIGAALAGAGHALLGITAGSDPERVAVSYRDALEWITDDTLLLGGGGGTEQRQPGQHGRVCPAGGGAHVLPQLDGHVLVPAAHDFPEPAWHVHQVTQ